MRNSFLAFLSLVTLSGCAGSKPETITHTVVMYETVPAALLRSCGGVAVQWNVVEDIINENTLLRGELSRCSAKVNSIRDWNNELLRRNAANAN